MDKKDFNNISIRGRVAFGIICFEKYVTAKYPNAEFAPVCELMWSIVSDKDYIDVSAERYMEIIPEYLYEFDAYEDAGFEFMSAVEFNAMRKLIPPDDDTLNLIMRRIYDIAMEHAYAAIMPPAKESIDMLFEIIQSLETQGIEVPDIEMVTSFTFTESGGWGAFISYDNLSKVLGQRQ